MPPKTYILGAGGFLGADLFEKFLRADPMGTIGYKKDECDLLSMESIERALSSVTNNDVIIIVSAVTRSVDNSYESMIANIQMAENISLFLRAKPVSQVVFFSTPDVYGLLPDGAKIAEDLIPQPNDYYSISKLAGEYLLTRDCARRGIRLAILRMTGIYGPRGDGKSTVNNLFRSARERGKITILDGGENLRDFVCVEDIAKVVMSSINKRINTTINVATGKSFPILDIAQMITDALGGGILIEYKDSIPSAEKRIKHMVYNTGRLQTLLPDIELTTIQEGIRKLTVL
ncbi:MAG: NAD(P)-dependent oxidoreductase [Proteobacteria bacterium]|nr:NAD(P)-dependent oxidoreductase [Pseudomonadota bacterium]